MYSFLDRAPQNRPERRLFETVGRHLYFGNGSEADDVTFNKLSSILYTKVLSMVHCVTIGRHKQSNNIKGVSFHKLPTGPRWKKLWLAKIISEPTYQRNRTALCVLITSLRIAMAGKSTSKFIWSNFILVPQIKRGAWVRSKMLFRCLSPGLVPHRIEMNIAKVIKWANHKAAFP